MARKSKFQGQCYYCGNPSYSREHAPPDSMFKGFDCDRITVPSCDKHNTSKSGDDQAIVNAFLIPLYNGLGKYILEDDVIQAIENAKSSFPYVKRKALNTPFLIEPPELTSDLPDVSHLVPSVDIYAWIRQLTAALVHNATQTFDSTIKWEAAVAQSPDWFGTGGELPQKIEQPESRLLHNTDVRNQYEQLDWKSGWSATPRRYPLAIYAFQVRFKEPEVFFKHRFYTKYTWYVRFSASHETISRLQKRISL